MLPVPLLHLLPLLLRQPVFSPPLNHPMSVHMTDSVCPHGSVLQHYGQQYFRVELGTGFGNINIPRVGFFSDCKTDDGGEQHRYRSEQHRYRSEFS